MEVRMVVAAWMAEVAREMGAVEVLTEGGGGDVGGGGEGGGGEKGGGGEGGGGDVGGGRNTISAI